MAIWDAKKICPEAIYVKRDFQWYGEISHRLQDIFGSFTDKVEYYSVDESFLDLTNFKRYYDNSYQKLAENIKKKVKQEVGIPVSVGVSLTRTLSKLAAKQSKPDGALAIGPSELKEFLKECPVEDLSGVGRKNAIKLHKYDIYTCLEFAKIPHRFIKRLLYKPGEEIWYELHGKKILPIVTERPERKAVGRGGSIGKAASDRNIIYANLIRNLERLTEALFKYRLETNCLAVILQDTNMHFYSNKAHLPDYSSDFHSFLLPMRETFAKIYSRFTKYRATHLLATPVKNINTKQLNLFYKKDPKKDKLREIQRQINEKHGRFTLRSGSTLHIPDTYNDIHNDHDICDIEGKICF